MEFPSKNVDFSPFLYNRNGCVAFAGEKRWRSDAINMIHDAFFSHIPLDGMRDYLLHIGLEKEGGAKDGDIIVELTKYAFKLVNDYSIIDMKPLLKFDGYGRGVILCCDECGLTGEKGFYSRFFGPKVGIDEDPVTGSAHCLIGPYFAKKRMKLLLSKAEKCDYSAMKRQKMNLRGRQCCPSRGGIVECKVTMGMDDYDHGAKSDSDIFDNDSYVVGERIGIAGIAVVRTTGRIIIANRENDE